MQDTEVVVAASTGQSMPSMVIVYFEMSVTKFSPVKVREVPPSTEPYLGLMEVKDGVESPTYVTGASSISFESPILSFGLQLTEDSVESMV